MHLPIVSFLLTSLVLAATTTAAAVSNNRRNPDNNGTFVLQNTGATYTGNYVALDFVTEGLVVLGLSSNATQKQTFSMNAQSQQLSALGVPGYSGPLPVYKMQYATMVVLGSSSFFSGSPVTGFEFVSNGTLTVTQDSINGLLACENSAGSLAQMYYSTEDGCPSGCSLLSLRAVPS